MKLSALKTNSASVEQGEWIGDLPEMGDLEVKVRGLGNRAYRELQNKLIQAVPLKLRRRGLTSEEQDRIQGRCLLETVLLDWRNLEGEDGAPVSYSRTLAETLLTDPDYASFRAAVIYAATLVGEGAADDDEELEKNSGASSAGG